MSTALRKWGGIARADTNVSAPITWSIGGTSTLQDGPTRHTGHDHMATSQTDACTRLLFVSFVTQCVSLKKHFELEHGKLQRCARIQTVITRFRSSVTLRRCELLPLHVNNRMGYVLLLPAKSNGRSKKLRPCSLIQFCAGNIISAITATPLPHVKKKARIWERW